MTHSWIASREVSATVSPRETTAEVNGIEAFPVGVEVNGGWGDTLIDIVESPDAAEGRSWRRVSNAGFTEMEARVVFVSYRHQLFAQRFMRW